MNETHFKRKQHLPGVERSAPHACSSSQEIHDGVTAPLKLRDTGGDKKTHGRAKANTQRGGERE